MYKGWLFDGNAYQSQKSVERPNKISIASMRRKIIRFILFYFYFFLMLKENKYSVWCSELTGVEGKIPKSLYMRSEIL